MSDRDAFREAREHGLKARHETREARAVRKQVAEEIALAFLNFMTNDILGRADISVDRAVAIAREIGSRDPA
jgi:hypothetical protein